MSVINKVLRDLDQRKVDAKHPASALDPVLRSGTASVPTKGLPLRAAPVAQTRWLRVIAPGMVLLLAVAMWEWQSGDLEKLQRAITGQARPAQVAPLPMVIPPPDVAPKPAAVASEPTVATAVANPVALRSSVLLAAPPETKLTAPKVQAPVLAASKPSPSVAVKVEPERMTAQIPVAAPVVPGTSVPERLQRQLQAARDAVAQAQTLFTAGSHDAAMDLLQQSVATTERAANTAWEPGNAALALLARELSRMQLAEGRAGAAWEMLTRLEPLIRNEPDLWAVRANAAQRLGRHQDSVHAYMTALQIRPTEQRWLLGTAVSLAALGQTASAAEMAEKARVAGPISKDVQTYLRQMGVPLKE